MDHPKKKAPPAPEREDTSLSGERRRIGRIVHDERGTAKVEWDAAPPDYERTPLSVEDGSPTQRNLKFNGGIAVLSIESDNTFDPYQRAPGSRNDAPAKKRDLRALSEWIKMMRALEERRKRGEEE